MTTSYKIALVAENLTSPMATYFASQLHATEWISCEVFDLRDVKKVSGVDLYVTLFEGASFYEIAAVYDYYRKSDCRAISISYWNDNLILGPTYFPLTTAGADSAMLFLFQQKLKKTPTATELTSLKTCALPDTTIKTNPSLLYTVFAKLVSELKCICSADARQKLMLVDNVLLASSADASGSRMTYQYIYPLFECEDRSISANKLSDYKILMSKYQHSTSHIENKFFVQKGGEEQRDEYRNVAIIGGGTAGYLTAIALRKSFPTLPVTLIESSKIPVIGVGEATTPEIRRFLFDKLQIPIVDFYKKVKPTWKLGIKFFWGMPGDYYFNYPFGKSDIRSAYLINNDINYCSLTSLLMSNNSSFVLSTLDQEGLERFLSLSNDISYALHLDNESFIGYLKSQALAMGVQYVDDLITGAEKANHGNEIASVIGEGGTKYTYDFYVDCSGFKSLLLEKILQSPYVSFSNSLFTDTAVTGCIRNSDKVKPYTLAESMNNGWCWNIPMRGEDHRGYVFSSAYCSIDEAADELKLKNPSIENIKTVKFKSGRHQEICIGNVFAIGNSYAFVEPLESTGIHMIIKEVETLTNNFSYLKNSPSVRSSINKNLNDHWDYLKGFLSIHYKFNKKFDTKFWKDCRSLTDITSIQWLVDLYDEVGLLSYANEGLARMITKEIKDDIFGLLGFDTLLLGQGVVPKNLKKGLQNKAIWDANVRAWKSIQLLTVPLERDLKILTEYPELI